MPTLSLPSRLLNLTVSPSLSLFLLFFLRHWVFLFLTVLFFGLHSAWGQGGKQQRIGWRSASQGQDETGRTCDCASSSRPLCLFVFLCFAFVYTKRSESNNGCSSHGSPCFCAPGAPSSPPGNHVQYTFRPGETIAGCPCLDLELVSFPHLSLRLWFLNLFSTFQHLSSLLIFSISYDILFSSGSLLRLSPPSYANSSTYHRNNKPLETASLRASLLRLPPPLDLHCYKSSPPSPTAF